MRLLLITYYFPPCGGAAVQRWLRWLPELVNAGFDVTVLTTLDGDYPETDASLLKEIPPELKILRVRAPRSGGAWKLLFGKSSSLPHGSLKASGKDGFLKRAMIWIRLNLIVPDLRVLWNPAAFKAARKFLLTNPIDAVITTGPPHSTHLLGLKLKRSLGLNWIADWRDPWSQIHYLKLNPPLGLTLRLHQRLERKVVKTADLNIVVSEQISRQLPEGRKIVIYNGFDARKSALAEANLTQDQCGDRFRIKFVGKVTAGQDLKAALAMIKTAFDGQDYELAFIGTGLDDEQRRLVDEYAKGHVRITDFLEHQQALNEMADAEALLLLINACEGFEGILTTKLFEYIAARNPILGVGPKGGEAEKLIRQYGAGDYFEATETAAGAEYLRKLHAAWRSNRRIKNDADVSALSAQKQALKLIERLPAKKSY